MVLGVVVLVLFAWLQVFLTRRFRRLFNPPLVLTSLTMATILGASLFGAEAGPSPFMRQTCRSG